MTDAENDSRRAAAEARRQRILARGRDRLQQITTGATAGADVAATDGAQVQVSAAPTLSAMTAKVPTLPSPAAGNVATLQGVAHAAAQPEHPVHHDAASDITAKEGRTISAGAQMWPTQDIPQPAAGSSSSPVQTISTLRQRTAASPAATLIGSTEMEALGIDDSTPGRQSQAVVARSTAGQQLRLAVQYTRLIRLLLAMVLAYMLTHGLLQPSLLRVPPLLLLATTQVAIIAGAYLLLSTSSLQHLLALGSSGEDQGDELAVAKLQGLNFVRMVNMLAPGLASAITTLQAVTEAATSVGDGAAMFLVSCILLQATIG